MQVVYRACGRIFESEKEAREFENSERIALIAHINAMKDDILPRAYKRTVLAKENFSVVFKMSKKRMVENAYDVSCILREVVRSKMALEEKIREYKELREQLKEMGKQNEQKNK